MITEDLIVYIQTQLRKNISKDTIAARLRNAGWREEDIDEGFRKIVPPTRVILKPKVQAAPGTTLAINPQELKAGSDPYREPQKIEDIKVRNETPVSLPERPAEKPVFATSFNEANAKNLTPSYYIPTNVTQSSEEVKPKLTPIYAARPPVSTAPEESKELMPTLTPKTPSPSLDSVSKPSPFGPAPSIPQESKIGMPIKVTGSVIVPENAILHSYPQVLSSSQELNSELSHTKKKRLLKRVGLVCGILILVGVAYTALAGYIGLPSLNLSFIKKDPKNLLINAPAALASLKSYKVETNATISMPLFADITNGLVSGQPVISSDRDSVSLFAEGMVNNNPNSMPTFDYLATLRGSLWKSDIMSDLKYGNGTSFITTPNVSELFGANAPAPQTVVFSKGELGSLVRLLPDIVAKRAKKIDFDKLFAIGIPSFVTEETASIFKDFVSSATVLEKEPEGVHGMDMYHYELSADRQSTKKFLSQFVDVFTNDLSVSDREALDLGLGATTLDSLEVWVGKDDGDIHQYKFVLSVPLSKLIGLEDRGIAGNTVSLTWQTTYYDFDMPNVVTLPEDTTTVADFLKSVDDMKIKNNISSFKKAADTFKNATGSFGKRVNSDGSCTNPNQGSLFSPVGHGKGASNAVGAIASILTNVLGITQGTMSCYSNGTAWALSAPLASDPLISFCADSAGLLEMRTTPLLGTSCK